MGARRARRGVGHVLVRDLVRDTELRLRGSGLRRQFRPNDAHRPGLGLGEKRPPCLAVRLDEMTGTNGEGCEMTTCLLFSRICPSRAYFRRPACSCDHADHDGSTALANGFKMHVLGSGIPSAASLPAFVAACLGLRCSTSMPEASLWCVATWWPHASSCRVPTSKGFEKHVMALHRHTVHAPHST